MVFESSRDYPIALPPRVATVVGTTLSRWFGGESVYTITRG